VTQCTSRDLDQERPRDHEKTHIGAMISLRRAVGRGVAAAVRAPRQSTRSVGATRLLTAHSAPRDDLRSAPVNRVVGVAPPHSDTHTARALHSTPVHRSSADSEVPNLSFEDHLEIVSQHLDMLQRNNKFGQGLKKIRVGPTHLPNSPSTHRPCPPCIAVQDVANLLYIHPTPCYTVV
jgi:hypothetical protein